MTTSARYPQPEQSSMPSRARRPNLAVVASSGASRGLEWPVDDGWVMPNDTERSIVGTNLHQEVIRNVADSLCIALEDNDPRPWGVGSQTCLKGFLRPTGDPVDCYPDVYVYDHPIPPTRATTYLEKDGSPVLAIEVYSDSTGRKDLDAQSGKAWIYGYGWRGGGVQEYLVFESAGEVLPEQVQAWRRDAAGVWGPWLFELESASDVANTPTDQSRATSDRRRWRSRTGVSFAVEGSFLRVYDAAGQRIIPVREAPPAIAAARAAADAERETRLRETEARREAEVMVAIERAARLEAEAELRRLRGER